MYPALIVSAPAWHIVPWEQLRVPHEVDDSTHTDTFAHLGPPASCCVQRLRSDPVLAVTAQIRPAQRSYRKGGERLILRSILKQGIRCRSRTLPPKPK
jgi:hypothetical protein